MANSPLQSNRREPGFTPFKVRVLLIDDQPIIAEALRRMLSDQQDIEFHYISDSQLTLSTALDLKPTVILQDLVMPIVDGFEAVRQLRAEPRTEDIPVIVLSSKEDPKLKAQGFACGANDYLVKLPDKLELIARIRYHSAAYISRLQRDDAFRFLRESQQKLADANIEMQKLAALDSLTGIANRRRFDDVMLAEWQRGKREKSPLSLLLCDIDDFIPYNNTHGHLTGDLCLKKTAAILTGNMKRPADLAARYAGPHFSLLLPDTNSEGALVVAQACRRQIEAMALPNPHSTTAQVVTLSIGVATIEPSNTVPIETLAERAGSALRQAKTSGRNQVVSA